MESARQGCPERLYDTFSAFSNQDDGGVIIFGLDEKSGFAQTGVYDAQDLQTKLMEVGEQMTPIVRPVFSVCQEDGLTFVSAEIPPLDLAERSLSVKLPAPARKSRISWGSRWCSTRSGGMWSRWCRRAASCCRSRTTPGAGSRPIGRSMRRRE